MTKLLEMKELFKEVEVEKSTTFAMASEKALKIKLAINHNLDSGYSKIVLLVPPVTNNSNSEIVCVDKYVAKITGKEAELFQNQCKEMYSGNFPKEKKSLIKYVPEFLKCIRKNDIKYGQISKVLTAFVHDDLWCTQYYLDQGDKLICVK